MIMDREIDTTIKTSVVMLDPTIAFYDNLCLFFFFHVCRRQ